MPANNFLPIAVGGSANVVSQATFAGLTALLANGFQSGILPSNQYNKALRQSSIMAAMLAQFIVDESGQPAIDDGTTATLEANLILAIQNLIAASGASNVTVNTTGGSTTLSSTQYNTLTILVTGVLVSNATLVFPTQTGRWLVVNNTTGAYTLTCKTAAGTGVTVTQGKADSVAADNVNVVYDLADVGTASPGDSTVRAASTAFVQAALSALLGQNVTVNTTGGSTTLNSTQYQTPTILVTGALVSNATLVFPTATGVWQVVNNTTGNYSVTAKTVAGNGVTITQGGTDTVVGDGVNVVYAFAETLLAASARWNVANLSDAENAAGMAYMNSLG